MAGGVERQARPVAVDGVGSSYRVVPNAPERTRPPDPAAAGGDPWRTPCLRGAEDRGGARRVLARLRRRGLGAGDGVGQYSAPEGLMLSGACNLSGLRYPPSIVSPPIRPCRWRTMTSRSGVHRGRERDP
jgi:hypothetical protein